MRRSNVALLVIIAFAIGGCNIHPLGWAAMFAFLRPPEGIVIGAIIVVIWLIYKFTEWMGNDDQK